MKTRTLIALPMVAPFVALGIALLLTGCKLTHTQHADPQASEVVELGAGVLRTVDPEMGVACYQTKKGDGISCVQVDEGMPNATHPGAFEEPTALCKPVAIGTKPGTAGMI